MRSSKHLAKILIPALIGVLLLAVGFWIYMGSMGKPYDSENAASVSVEIPSGTSAAGIAQTLEDNGIIASAGKFRFWSKSKGWDSQYKAGTYALSPSMDYTEIAEILVGRILDDYDYSGSEVAVLVNGLGGTPLMELYILNMEVQKILEEKGIKAYRTFVGNYCTSIDMTGASVTLMKLDDELKELLDAPCDTPALKI